MKNTVKILSFVLALLMLATCFVACGGAEETDAESETVTETETETENNLDAYGREIVADDIPADLNYEGADNPVITFFTRNDNPIFSVEIDADQLIDETLNDAVYRRNLTVEERIGVEIRQIAQLGNYGPHVEWLQTLRNAVNTKSGDFDAAAVYASQGSALALEGIYYNVNKIDAINTEKPWWNGDVMDDLEIFGCTFFLGGDLAISQLSRAGIVVYNKTLFEKYYTALNLYDMVEEKKWTIDELYDLTSPVWEDINGSGTVDDGDLVGITGWAHSGANSWLDSWVAALGVSITKKNSDGIPELAFYSARTVDAFEKLRMLHRENGGSLCVNSSGTSMINENAMFSTRSLESCESLRDMTSPYGVLPLPMYDVDQGEYATYPQNSCSVITVISSLSDDRVEMVGTTLELMAAESYRQVLPEYCEVCLKSKYSADAEDAQMFDVIVDSVRIDFGFVFATNKIASINSLFRNLDRDFAQTYESNASNYETSLEALIDALDDIALTLG